MGFQTIVLLILGDQRREIAFVIFLNSEQRIILGQRRSINKLIFGDLFNILIIIVFNYKLGGFESLRTRIVLNIFLLIFVMLDNILKKGLNLLFVDEFLFGIASHLLPILSYDWFGSNRLRR